MSNKEMKIKAAIAGAIQLIDLEQKVLVRAEPIPPNIPTNWSYYSRQVIMLNRDQMQRRVLKR